jgi:hypothetical protein
MQPYRPDGCTSAGVFVISRLLVLANLHDREHTTHFDCAKGALAAHHRQRIIRQRHFHFTHVRLAAVLGT